MNGFSMESILKNHVGDDSQQNLTVVDSKPAISILRSDVQVVLVGEMH